MTTDDRPEFREEVPLQKKAIGRRVRTARSQGSMRRGELERLSAATTSAPRPGRATFARRANRKMPPEPDRVSSERERVSSELDTTVRSPIMATMRGHPTPPAAFSSARRQPTPGVGFPAEVVRRVDDLGRSEDGRRPGDLAFAWAIVRTLAERRGRLEPQLEIEGHGRAVCAFVANGRPYTYAGRLALPIAREAEFGRGLDLIAPIEVPPLALPSVAARVLSGHASGRRFLREHDLDRIEIRCDVPLPLHADGEDLGDVERAVFEAERAAVSVLV